MRIAYLLAVLLLSPAAISGVAVAQTPDVSANAVIQSMKQLHDLTANNLIRTAEMLDDAVYAYRPTDEVRTAGQLLAHLAGAQFFFCSTAAGEANPSGVNYEETATTKAEIVAGLRSGLEYCAGVYDGMTDADGSEMRQMFGMNMAATAILAFNSAHNQSHYGNLVTYMRINGIVPPSSE